MIDSEIKRRSVPDFFKDVKTLNDWENTRKSIKEMFLANEYGHLPPKIEPTVREELTWQDFCAGKTDWKSIYFTFENEKGAHTVKTELFLPKGKENVNVFLYVGFQAEIPNRYLPVEEILDNGFGIMTFYYQDVSADNNDFEDGLSKLFNSESREYSKISLWAYMASACMDYLCTRSEVDSERVAIVGHSRLGKTALLASALDERFILTCSNDSGCCGAAITRGKTEENETLAKITEVFPFWFTKEFFKYVNNEDALPFDQHMLLALIAPRYLMIGAAIKDVWADNDGQYLSCVLASKIWELYGKDGFICDPSIPKEPVTYAKGCVSFYMREGTHFMSRTDWLYYMAKFKEILETEKH